MLGTKIIQWASGDAVAKAINWKGSAGYAAAKYAEIQTNNSYVGGLVRQYGNLSYIRTYQAGHAIPSYQPETAYRIFTRALFNLDIATGTVSTSGNYTSKGRDDPNVQLFATPQDLTYCYTWNIGDCYEWQQDTIANGTAEICNYIFVDANSTKLFPEVVARCRGESHNGSGSSNNSLPVPEFEGSAESLSSRRMLVTSVISIIILALLI